MGIYFGMDIAHFSSVLVKSMPIEPVDSMSTSSNERQGRRHSGW